jgi:hypothetical protein
VVWHHGEIPAAIVQFPVVNLDDVPSAWPEERFDLVWVLKRNADASQYTFSQLNQKLLDGDQP